MSSQHNDPVLEITQSILAEAAQRPWLAALLMRRRPSWLMRLAQLAQGVLNLPRHTRRALRRKLTTGLATAALLLALAGPPPTLYAASITVNGDGSGGTCSLADAIASANSDTAVGNCETGSGIDTINLTVDVPLTAVLPDVVSDITLEGGGHIITGTNAFPVFTVKSGYNFTLNETTISSNSGGHRPVVAVSSPASLLVQGNRAKVTLNRSTVSGNTRATTRHLAGAAHGKAANTVHAKVAPGDATTIGSSATTPARHNGAKVTLKQSFLSGNGQALALHNGATVMPPNPRINRPTDSASGGIVNEGTLTVTNSTITGQVANAGAGITNYGTALVSNSTISYNTANLYGGGILNAEGMVTLENSTLLSNTANMSSTLYGGGGLFNALGLVSIEGSTILSNTANGSTGGGLLNLFGTLTVDGSTLSGNSAVEGGGAINLAGGLDVISSTISGNAGYIGGGGLMNYDGAMTVTSSQISDDASVYGGGLVGLGGTFTVTGSTIAGNIGLGGGGGLFIQYGAALVQSSTISNNASLDGGGGGIFNYNGTLTVTNNSTISSNYAYHSGGGIYSYGGNARVEDATLSDNTAYWNYGGGIYNASPLTVQNSTFSGNYAYVDGGGLYSDGTLTMTNSTLSDNTAYGGRGGGLFNNLTAEVINSTLSGNTAYTSGGGLYNNGLVTLQSSIVALQTVGSDCGYSASPPDSNGYNIDSDGSCKLTGTGDQPGKNAAALKLLPLANNGGPTWTQALDTGSVALEQIPPGTNGCGTTITTDQRGEARPGSKNATGKCEVGAWEAQGADPTAVTLRDFNATTHAAPGLVGLIGATLAALGVTWSLRRRRTQ